MCHFVLVFFSPFSIAITSLGEERANLIAFRTFVRFVLVWICRFPLPLGVWEGLRFVIVALPGLISYLFVIVALPGLFFLRKKKLPGRLASAIACTLMPHMMAYVRVSRRFKQEYFSGVNNILVALYYFAYKLPHK